MSRPDVDEVLNYLSIKFNKIFCERDFVCSVTEDFQTILDKNKGSCILVFPTLGPTYLKALRYQAKIFDLAVFNISSASGRFKSVAICHKDHLKKKNPVKDETMSETSKRKRPERQLYVPPAQRASRLSKCEKVTDCANKSKDKCVVLSLSDVHYLYLSLSFKCAVSGLNSSYQHRNCQFTKFLNVKFNNHIIKIYDCAPFVTVFWRLNQFYCPKLHTHGRCYPEFDYNEEITQRQPTVLVNCERDFDSVLVDNWVCHVECNANCDVPEMVDLSILGLGHFFIISVEDGDYFHECQEKHSATECYTNIRASHNTRLEKSNMDASKTNKDFVNNHLNINNKKVANDKHEQEKEIMRMTKEYMNRKTRPIMKYVDNSNDTLKIDKNDSVNNWEDLFDDDGQIQEELLTDIVDKVGDDVTIVKAAEDYTAYTNKPVEELEHVVELYNFPASLETHDLVQAFSHINSDAMYIKWVDDTHALLVLGSLSQAQKAINMRNPLIKVRPMTAASPMSMDVANKSDLKPAMKRPPTNLQTARRLITTHLGTKSKITKEQIAKEKQDLKNAKEMKRLIKQNEKDAWEGNLRSAVN